MSENRKENGGHHPNVKDISNQRFGQLTAVRPGGVAKNRVMMWWCVCDCGMGYRTYGSLLRNGTITRCILCAYKAISKQKIIHGMESTSEYRSWRAMIGRCLNKNTWNYNRYGGSGIVPCEGFRIASVFLTVMGLKPTPSHSLDRVKNSIGYTCGECSECLENGYPMNCRWATAQQQARNQTKNKIIEYNGESLCAAEWASRTGLKPTCILSRLGAGWSPAEILTTPLRKRLNKVNV